MVNILKYTGGIAETNSYWLMIGDKRVLVDAPEGAYDWVKEKGVDILLITHQHFDHVMDAGKIQKECGAEIFAWQEFLRSLTLEHSFSSFGPSFSVEGFKVDHACKEENSITVGEKKLMLLHVPGHSPDSLCFFYEEEKVLFGGDVLFAGSVGRTDLEGGDFALLIKGIHEKILVLPKETRVLPGHITETTIEEEKNTNPYLKA